MSSFSAKSCLTCEANSQQAAIELARGIWETADGETLKAVIINSTVSHHQEQFFETFIEKIGPGPDIIGSTTQGAMARGIVEEKTFVASALGIYGSGITSHSARVNDIGVESKKKGIELGKKIMDQVDSTPKVAILLYDPLSGVDLDALIAGVHDVLPCTIVGGGAGQAFGSLGKTHQYHNRT